ncbi:oligosaccharide flippase family protein [Vibrio sp. 10N.286.51.F4]|uniref:oligosaccharide flippase family protein n=1 Tax=Vibrio sp. 10N.286.51.F4 TaxID=3229710 RepID=UPI0035528E69
MKVFDSKILSFLFSNYLIKGIGYSTQILLVYILTVEELGHVRIAMSYFELFNIIAGCGLTTTLLKINSNNKITSENKIENTVSSLVFSFWFSLLVSLCVYMSFSLGLLTDSIEVNTLGKVLSISIILSSIVNILVINFQVSGRFKDLAKSQAISKLLSFTIFFPLVYYFEMIGYVYYIYIGFLITIIIILIFDVGVNFKDFLFRLFVFRTTIGFYINNFKLSIYALLSNILSVINKYAAIYLISFIGVDNKEFGLYSISLTMFVLLEIITYTIQQYFLPKLSFDSDSQEKWTSTFKYIECKTITVHGVIALISSMMIYFVVDNFFIEYIKVAYYFCILAFSWFLMSFYSIKGPAMISLGKTEFNFMASAIVFIPIILLSYYFVNEFGVLGVAFAKVMQCFFSILSNHYFLKKALINVYKN